MLFSFWLSFEFELDITAEVIVVVWPPVVFVIVVNTGVCCGFAPDTVDPPVAIAIIEAFGI